jgi:hypothetical protein
MIGDQRYTEALDFHKIRLVGVVGERCMGLEAGVKTTVESTQVRMQT